MKRPFTASWRDASPAAKLVVRAFTLGLLVGAVLASLASLLLDPPLWTITIITPLVSN